MALVLLTLVFLPVRQADAQPLGLPKLDRSPDAELVLLGRRLFSDPALSAAGDLACASCHRPNQSFVTPGQAIASGSSGARLKRNTPTVVNSVFTSQDLKVQAQTPLLNPLEMANETMEALVARLQGPYPGLTEDRLLSGLEAYQQSLLSGNSRFDRWYFAQDEAALTNQEVEGFTLFSGRAECNRCHLVSADHAVFSDLELSTVGLSDQLIRTPSLRDVSRTWPYMADGSLKTLADVVSFYSDGNSLMPTLALDVEEQAALTAFLKSLDGEAMP